MQSDVRKYKISLVTPILGSQPSPRVLTTFLHGKIVEEAAKYGMTKDEIEARLEYENQYRPNEAETMYTSFFKDEDGVYLADYQVKGFLKEAADVMSASLPAKVVKKKGEPEGVAHKKGLYAARQKIERYLFVFPRMIRIADAVDGELQRPIRFSGYGGTSVSALTASEVVNPPKEFFVDLELIENQFFDWEAVDGENGILWYGARAGIGRWRSAGYGRFTFERVS